MNKDEQSNSEFQQLQHQGTVPAEAVMIQAQQIGALVQLATFLKAAELTDNPNGMGVKLQLADRHGTFVWVGSELIKEALTAELNRLGSSLDGLGVDLTSMLAGEKQRFLQLYGAGTHQSN